MCRRERITDAGRSRVVQLWVPNSSSSMCRKAVPGFLNQADTADVFVDLNQVTVCSAAAKSQQSGSFLECFGTKQDH